jgi:Protein of unknown function (DUF3592)
MEQEKRRLSLKQILWTDYPAFYASLVPLAAWIVYLAWAPDWRGDGPIIRPEARSFFLTLVILASVGGLIVLAYRLWLISSTFRKGVQLRGKISKIELRRDHGRIEYVYIFDQKEYFSSTSVHRNAKTKELKAGTPVTLVVDQSKPSRAFIRDLYTNP